jgi:hypothetical protein
MSERDFSNEVNMTRLEWTKDLKEGDRVTVSFYGGIRDTVYAGTVQKVTPTGLIKVRWGQYKEEEFFKPDGSKRGHKGGAFGCHCRIEPYVEKEWAVRRQVYRLVNLLEECQKVKVLQRNVRTLVDHEEVLQEMILGLSVFLDNAKKLSDQVPE